MDLKHFLLSLMSYNTNIHNMSYNNDTFEIVNRAHCIDETITVPTLEDIQEKKEQILAY